MSVDYSQPYKYRVYVEGVLAIDCGDKTYPSNKAAYKAALDAIRYHEYSPAEQEVILDVFPADIENLKGEPL